MNKIVKHMRAGALTSQSRLFTDPALRMDERGFVLRMLFLSERRDYTLEELAEIMCCSRRKVSEIIADLVAKRYVDRRRGEGRDFRMTFLDVYDCPDGRLVDDSKIKRHGESE